jgi:hypothetical protein
VVPPAFDGLGGRMCDNHTWGRVGKGTWPSAGRCRSSSPARPDSAPAGGAAAAAPARQPFPAVGEGRRQAAADDRPRVRSAGTWPGSVPGAGRGFRPAGQ